MQEKDTEEGSPARELEPTSVYRLGIDIGAAEGKVPGRLLDEKTFLWLTKEFHSWATKEDKLWLGHSSA
jgi:hypothetical protein